MRLLVPAPGTPLGPAWLVGSPARGRSHSPPVRGSVRTAVAFAIAITVKFLPRGLGRFIVPVKKPHKSLARNLEVAGAVVVDQVIVSVDLLLLDQGRRVGINLAADADRILVAVDPGELGLGRSLGLAAVADILVGRLQGIAASLGFGLALGRRAKLSERDFLVGKSDHLRFAVEQRVFQIRSNNPVEVRPGGWPAVGVGRPAIEFHPFCE